MSLHHIVPKNRGGYRGKDKNTVDIEHKIHQEFHSLFGDASPLQQIQQILALDHFYGNKGQGISELIISTKSKQHSDLVYKKGIVVKPEKLWLPIACNSNNPNKIAKATKIIFHERTLTEQKIMYILNIADSVLTEEIKHKLLNIIN